MRPSIFQRLSLKSRVTLFTLLIFLISLWSLTIYASRMLREDLEQVLSQQQFATVSLVAAEVNHDFGMRRQALEKMAALSGEALAAGRDRALPAKSRDLPQALGRMDVPDAFKCTPRPPLPMTPGPTPATPHPTSPSTSPSVGGQRPAPRNDDPNRLMNRPLRRILQWSLRGLLCRLRYLCLHGCRVP